MINALTFTNRFGRSLRCVLRAPERSGFAITSIDGLGPGRANVNLHSIVTGDGGFFGSARFDARNIVINFRFIDAIINDRYTSIEEIRHWSYEFFAPKTQLQIFVETDERTLVIRGYVESNEPDIFSPEESADISILCPGYYFKMVSADQDSQHVSVYGEGLFEFPFSNESTRDNLIEFGAMDSTSDYTLNYGGDAETGFTLTITFFGDTVQEIVLAIKARGNTGLTNLGFLDGETPSALLDWDDFPDTDPYISLNLSTVANKLATRYTQGSIYASGNRIIIGSETGNKFAYFIGADNQRYNILDCFEHLEWLKLYPGYNYIRVTPDDDAVGKFSVSVDFEALYAGV